MKKAIIAKIGEYNQLSLRISSLDQKQARGGIPQREKIFITMSCLACFMLYAYVPSVALILMHLVCIWHVKINLSNF